METPRPCLVVAARDRLSKKKTEKKFLEKVFKMVHGIVETLITRIKSNDLVRFLQAHLQGVFVRLQNMSTTIFTLCAE